MSSTFWQTGDGICAILGILLYSFIALSIFVVATTDFDSSTEQDCRRRGTAKRDSPIPTWAKDNCGLRLTYILLYLVGAALWGPIVAVILARALIVGIFVGIGALFGQYFSGIKSCCGIPCGEMKAGAEEVPAGGHDLAGAEAGHATIEMESSVAQTSMALPSSASQTMDEENATAGDARPPL
jgi:hypothetical protein